MSSLSKLSILFFLCCMVYPLYAQESRNDYIWLFGYEPNIPEDSLGGSMMNFHSQPVDISFFNIPFNALSFSIASDKNGNLVGYSNGCQIINRNHELMGNGDGINPGQAHNNYCNAGTGYPFAQGMTMLPCPGNDSLYYLFHIRFNDQLYTTDLLYSVVNAAGNNGLGEVTEKNVLLLQDTFADQLQAVRHGNGRDWWIVAPKVGSNIHYLFLLSPQGIEGPFVQQEGTGWNSYYWAGQAIFSPNGNKYIRVSPFNGIYIFDFDRCGGVLSNPLHLEFVGDTIYGATCAGVSVSPNNRYLYVSLTTKFYQYDLWADDIGASRQLIAVYDGFLSFFPTTFFQHMLAPDGKIYITCNNSVNRLHVIHQPNEPGTACNLEQHGIRLPALHAFAAPNFPHFRLYDLPGSVCDTLGISTAGKEPALSEANIKVFPNPAHEAVYLELPVAIAMTGKLLIWSADGRIMHSSEINGYVGQRLSITTASWPAGIYLAMLRDEAGTTSSRFTFVVTH